MLKDKKLLELISYKYLRCLIDLNRDEKILDVKVWGTSMMPLLRPGERYPVIIGYDYRRLNVGDIIMFRKFNDHNTLHRIVDIELGIDYARFNTKGDANSYVDKYTVDHNEYIGKLLLLK